MKLLFISNYYPPYEVGGYEQLCRDVAIRLVERGHDVRVLTSNRGCEEAASETVYRALRIMPDPDAWVPPVLQFFLTRRTTEALNRLITRDIVTSSRPDVVMIWNLQGLPHELACDIETVPKVAVVYWLAGYSPAQPDIFWEYWIQPPRQRSALRPAKAVLSRVALAQMRREGRPVTPKMNHVAVVSDFMRRSGIAKGTLPAHTQVIYNGVETELFYHPVPPPDTLSPLTLLYAGRVSVDKGVHIVLEALGQVAQQGQERRYRLVVAGTGPQDYQNRLRMLAREYGIERETSFVGWLPREEMPALMHSSQVLVLPTLHPEPFARVVLEAMASGLAVIGSLTGGTGELLQDGVNGLTYEASSSQALASKISLLISDPATRCRLAQEGQQTVLTRFSLDRMVDEVELLLERAVREQVAA